MSTLLKIIKNVKIMTEENYTKHRKLLSMGPSATIGSSAEVDLSNRQPVLYK